MESKLIADRAARPVSAPGENAAAYTFLGLFAILLALVTSRHEMYVDEGQAWLIARDSQNLLEAFQHLRYEGHPRRPAGKAAATTLVCMGRPQKSGAGEGHRFFKVRDRPTWP
jgi:hypothetical protein